jgi:hypothetical protein
MDVFPDEKHLSSWAGMSPGSNESAGKKKYADNKREPIPETSPDGIGLGRNENKGDLLQG